MLQTVAVSSFHYSLKCREDKANNFTSFHSLLQCLDGYSEADVPCAQQKDGVQRDDIIKTLSVSQSYQMLENNVEM